MDGERQEEARLPPTPELITASAATTNLTITETSDATTTDGSATPALTPSIFQFHPRLQPKNKATPRATTSRNLVFPEPGDAATELPVAPASIHSGSSARDDVHQRSKQPSEPKLAMSARKYLVPQQDGGGGKLAHEPAAAAADSSHSHQLQQHRRLAVVAPRSLCGKIQFYALRVCQCANGSLRCARIVHRQLSFQQKIAYLLILSGMLSESATPAPRYNVPIGITTFMHPASRFDHRMVVSGLCLTIIVDIVWLLRPQEGSFNGFFRVQYANYAHSCLGICTLLKVLLVFSTYSDLGPEPDAQQNGQQPLDAPNQQQEQQQSPPARPHHPVWHHIKFFFPRKTYPRCSHLSFEVLMRTLALVWIHGLCGIALLVLGVLSAMLYAGKVQFRSSALGAPLHVMMLLRSATTLASYFIATQHMSYNGCLKLFGCRKIAEIGESEDGGSGSDIVLKYNKRWLRRVQRAKALDALVGVYFVLVFYSAFHSGQFFAGSGLTAVLVTTGLVVLVLDFWTPLLILVVAKCGAMLHAHHKRGTVDVDPYYPNQLEWEEGDDSGAEKDGSGSESDASSSSGDSSSLSSSSSESSSSGYSTTASQIRRRRQRRLRRRERKDEERQTRALSRDSSRKPLLKRQNSMPIVDAHEHSAINDQRLTSHEFHLLWDALSDGGSFICRVSRIPNAQELSRHLLRNNFVVASDDLNDEDLRVSHFYAPVVAPLETDKRFNNGGSSGGRLSARLQQQFFLGEFIFDSLALKLFAKFRCPRQDAIVPFVKRLQLKEIVGSYAPCE